MVELLYVGHANKKTIGQTVVELLGYHSLFKNYFNSLKN